MTGKSVKNAFLRISYLCIIINTINLMTDRLSLQGKWNFMLELSHKQSMILADHIWKGCMQETPKTLISYESFCQYLRNNEMSISERFDEFNKEGKFTEALPKHSLSEIDVCTYINQLISKTALSIVGSTFYTD